jgi:putative ABC transport system substrate-binding protein
MTPSADPAVAGIVESLDHPGGNITGITEMMPELTPERLKLLTQIVTNISRVAILWRPGTLSRNAFDQMLNDTQATARSIGVQIQIVEAAKVDDFDGAFATIAKERADGLIVLINPIYGVQQKQIIERAMNHKLPAIYEWKVFAKNGGLISYGADVQDVYRRAAVFVDRIFKGAMPADLPVEQPTKFELVINLKIAKALGLTVPPTLLGRADEVIE